MALGIGVELGPAAVRAIVVERAGQRLKLRAVHEAPCDTANLDALSRTLAHLRRTLSLSQPVVLGLPSTATILTTLAPLVVNPRRATLALAFELQQQLPFELRDAVWHYQWLAPTNGRSHPTKKASSAQPSVASPGGAVVAAIRRSLLDERLAACRRAGLTVQTVGVNPVAALNAWAAGHTGSSSAMTALLHVIDEHLAEWIVWTPTTVQVIPVTSPSPLPSGEALQAAWEALQGQGTERPRQVWMLGGPDDVAQRCREALTKQAGLEGVERFDVMRLLGGGARVEQPQRFVAALGLALQGLGQARVGLNLISEAQRDVRARHLQRVSLLIGGACLLAAMGFGLSGMLEVSRRRTTLLNASASQERLYQALRPDVRALLQRQERILQRSRQLEQMIEDAPRLMRVVAQIAEALPESLWLTKLDCSKELVLKTSGEGQQAVVTVLLDGRSRSFQDVTQLLDRLKNLPGVTGVKPLSTSVTTDAATGKELVVFAIQVQQS